MDSPAAPKLITLRSPVPGVTVEVPPRGDDGVLRRQLFHRFTLVIAPINLVIATITYVFVAYVVPLPGPAPPARARIVVLIAAIMGFVVAWAVCELWGRRSFVPVGALAGARRRA